MKPYAEQRQNFKTSVSAQKEGSSALGLAEKFLGAIANAQISAVTALAFILFAAVSAGAITLISYSEIASSDSYAQNVNIQKSVKPKVLGLDIYGYNQPSCGQWICLNYQLADFAIGKWNVNIGYNGTQGPAVGSVKVNNNKFVYNIRNNGFTYTGYNLVPGTKYNFIFYSGLLGTGKILAKMSFVAPSAPSQAMCNYPSAQQGCYYDMSKADSQTNCGGVLVCQSAPSYGYQTPSGPSYGYNLPANGSQNGTYTEGWVDQFTPTPSGQLYIGGWAYDTDKSLSINISLLNTQTGQSRTFHATPTIVKSYVNSYLSNKFKIGGIVIPVGFEIITTDLPAGSYRINGATFNRTDGSNGANFYINGSAQGSLNVTGHYAAVFRVGQLVNINGTVVLIGQNGYYGIPSLAVFNSWGWSFTNVVAANSAEIALSQIGVVPAKIAGCNSALDQIAGICGDAKPKIIVLTSDPLVLTQGIYGKINLQASQSAASSGNLASQYTFTETGSVPGMVFSSCANHNPTVNTVCPPIVNMYSIYLDGVPTTPGSFPVTVTAKDQNGNIGSQSFMIIINSGNQSGQVSLLAALSSASPVSQTVSPWSGRPMAVYNFTTSGGSVLIQEMDFTVVGSFVYPINSIVVNGQTISVNNNNITATGINTWVPNNGNITVSANYAAAAATTQVFKLNLTTVKYLDSNSVFHTLTTNVTSNPMTINGVSVPAPSISYISPVMVKVGNMVTVYGANFDSGTFVIIDGANGLKIPLSATNLISSNSLSFIVPSSLAVGLHSVSVNKIASSFPLSSSVIMTVTSPTTISTVTGLTFNSASVVQGGSYTSTISGSYLSGISFDAYVTYPGGAGWVNNWQTGASQTQQVGATSPVGSYTVSSLRIRGTNTTFAVNATIKVTAIISTVTGLSFGSASVVQGGSYTSTIIGNNINGKSFDAYVTYPGGTNGQMVSAWVNNWQTAATQTQQVGATSPVGNYSVSQLRISGTSTVFPVGATVAVTAKK